MAGSPFATASRYGRTVGTVGDSFGPTFYVDTVNGQAGNSGLFPTAAFKTMGAAFAALSALVADGGSMAASNATIFASGDIREQLDTPLGVYGVKIISLVGGRPRNATEGGVVVPGNGVNWRAPATPTADEPLLRLRTQGWEVHNMMFVPASGIAGIELRRAENATYPDPSHAVIANCRFQAADTTATIGIEDIGGSNNVEVVGCVFSTLASGIVNTSSAIALPLRWTIDSNVFIANTEHIDSPLSKGVFSNNVMDEATVNVNFAGGENNHVFGNHFDNDAANIAPADGYTAGTGDSWQDNYANDAVYYGVPA